MDTFIVTQVLMVPGNGTRLALFTLQDKGVAIVDTETQTILQEYNVR